MPHAVRLFAIEHSPRLDRCEKSGLEFITWSLLLNQRQPFFPKVIIDEIAHGYHGFACEQVHGIVLGSSLQIEMGFIAKDIKSKTLITVQCNNKQLAQ